LRVCSPAFSGLFPGRRLPHPDADVVDDQVSDRRIAEERLR
jgi:hypothetical protein